MLAPTTKPARPANVAAFWLGIQAVWGAVLALSLQSRTIELATGNPLVEVGWILALGGVVAAVSQIAASLMSDRRRAASGGRTQFYIAGTAIGAIGIGWFYLAPTILQLTIGFAIMEAGLNVATGAYQAVVPDTIEPQRTGLASSWLAGMQSVGNGLGALAATFIVQSRLLAGTLIAVLVATCAITVSHVRGRSLVPIAPTAHATPVGNFANLFGSRMLLYAGFYTLLDYLLLFVGTLSPLASARQVIHDSGVAALAFTVSGALGALLVARVTDRFDKRAITSLGGAIFGIAVVGLSFVPSVGALTVVAVGAGVGWGIVLAADWALACRILPPRAMAFSMAVWNLAILLAQIGAPVLVNKLIGNAQASWNPHALHEIFALAAVETAVGILWIWRLPRGLARE